MEKKAPGEITELNDDLVEFVRLEQGIASYENTLADRTALFYEPSIFWAESKGGVIQ